MPAGRSPECRGAARALRSARRDAARRRRARRRPRRRGSGAGLVREHRDPLLVTRRIQRRPRQLEVERAVVVHDQQPVAGGLDLVLNTLAPRRDRARGAFGIVALSSRDLGGDLAAGSETIQRWSRLASTPTQNRSSGSSSDHRVRDRRRCRAGAGARRKAARPRRRGCRRGAVARPGHAVRGVDDLFRERLAAGQVHDLEREPLGAGDVDGVRQQPPVRRRRSKAPTRRSRALRPQRWRPAGPPRRRSRPLGRPAGPPSPVAGRRQ